MRPWIQEWVEVGLWGALLLAIGVQALWWYSRRGMMARAEHKKILAMVESDLSACQRVIERYEETVLEYRRMEDEYHDIKMERLRLMSELTAERKRARRRQRAADKASPAVKTTDPLR